MDNDTRSRLFTEYSELSQRVKKLESFITSDKFELLPDVDRTDLREQLKHMRAYWDVLSRRCSRQCNNA